MKRPLRRRSSPSAGCATRRRRAAAAAAAATAALAALANLPAPASANVGVFAYYDDPFTAPGSVEKLQVGPASWRNLLIPDNQCGGYGQKTGYGQSPVVVPRRVEQKCDTDRSGYEFQGGRCGFDDLRFRILTNGVIVGPKAGSECALGRMKIPGHDRWYDALQLHIHAGSEHSVDGRYFPAEMHIVHREANGKDMASYSTFIDAPLIGPQVEDDAAKEAGNDDGSDALSDDGTHEVFEHYLRGWEAVATQSEEFCAATPGGSGVFTPNRLFTSKQRLLQCPPVGSGVTADDIANLEWATEDVLDVNAGMLIPIRVPALKSPEYPEGPIPLIYDSLPTDSEAGIYTYRGGLTTPPCTEIVRWNLLDKPMIVSSSQLDRLTRLILCFVERSTCRHATVASIFGGTNRPPQDLKGRTVTHRCKNGPKVSVAMKDPESPASGYAYHADHHAHPHWALLYPWFVMVLGIAVYFLLSRYAHALPYTAVLFILGTFMGIGIVALDNTDQLSESTRMWANIDSHTLLLVFLPGLLFRDAFCLNVYLLKDAIGQCLIMAFPMVLAGTALLALVGFYILPYGWSFSLCMTFGAILSATDPVAVSALLNEVGAPPRLKMHIAGESLLNDGSAIVFYTIFAQMFLYELNIPGLGKDIDAAAGFALFFQMSLGAAAIGLAFGIGLIRMLHHLNRRFQAEESVVQVTASITIAYLTYYVAEAVCHTSGVLAVVMCGIVTKAFGDNMINDKVMMEKFWLMVEHLLNTLIFALGGVVWGTVISNSDPRRSETFSGKDWGYLVLVYVLIMIIRTFLFAAFFPIIGRIGLKSNWKEAVFISFGGLRGAVGIAMAIALDSELRRDTVPGDPRRDFTSQLFGLTGGIALLTLLINGTLCGPLLRKLGLADSTEMREKIVEQYRHGLKEKLMDVLLEHLSDPRYEKADFAVIRRHVPSLSSVTSEELKLAVKRQKANTPTHEYKKPNLESFRGFVGEQSMLDLMAMARVSSSAMLQSLVARTTLSSVNLQAQMSARDLEGDPDEHEMTELRKLFVELLRFAYKEQVEKGEVEVREGLVVFTLEKSLEYAADAVADGRPICDWDKLRMLSNPWESRFKDAMDMKTSEAVGQVARRASMRNIGSMRNMAEIHAVEEEDKKAAGDVQRAVAFIAAHKTAQRLFKEQFCGNRLLTPAERAVLDESRKQSSKAEEMIQSKDSLEVGNIVSHLLCTVLLNNAASYIGNLVTQGLLREREGEEYMHELVEHELHAISGCVKNKMCKRLEEDGEEDPGDVDGEEGRFKDRFEDEPNGKLEDKSAPQDVTSINDSSHTPKLRSRFSASSLTSLKEEGGETVPEGGSDDSAGSKSPTVAPLPTTTFYENNNPESDASLGGINF